MPRASFFMRMNFIFPKKVEVKKIRGAKIEICYTVIVLFKNY